MLPPDAMVLADFIRNGTASAAMFDRELNYHAVSAQMAARLRTRRAKRSRLELLCEIVVQVGEVQGRETHGGEAAEHARGLRAAQREPPPAGATSW